MQILGNTASLGELSLSTFTGSTAAQPAGAHISLRGDVKEVAHPVLLSWVLNGDGILAAPISGAQGYDRHARQFVAGASLALLTAVALPPGKTVGRELPKPRIDHGQERSFVKPSLSLQTFVALPNGKRVGFDLPKAQRDPKIARDWTAYNTLPLSTIVVVANPFIPQDWSRPRKPRLDVAGRDLYRITVACRTLSRRTFWTKTWMVASFVDRQTGAGYGLC